MDTIHRGFLMKEGGHGHQYKNEKKRWFVLKDMFLFYYSGVPVATKNTLKLKGVIYLAVCKTKDNPKQVTDTFVLSSAKKEYVLSSVSANPTADILSWRNSMEYAIEKSGSLEKEGSLSVVTGWLTKKGGKGHTYQNWKKRWFILKGNILFYYEDKDEEMETRGWANLEKMKGFIEISMITDIDADISSDGNGFQFIVTVNNDKSYILATKSLDEKTMWITALRERIIQFSKNAMQVSLNTCSQEIFVKSGELKRHLSLKRSSNNYFVLTNVNLRVYPSKPDLAHITENWGKGMIACIPLLGCSIQSSDDSDEWDLKQNEMAIIEIQGHAYVLETASVQERMDWIFAMKNAARNLAKQVIQAGETIRLTCNASDKNDHNAGYTIVTIDRSELQLKYLMLKKLVIIPFDKLKLVFLQPGFLLCLKYAQGDKAKQLKMKCGNASGIFEAVEAIFELVQKSADRLTRHSTTSARALAHPSVTDTDLLMDIAPTMPLKPTRKLTKEMILTSRQSEDSAITHAIASSSSSSSLNSSNGAASNRYSHMGTPSFSDFHYQSAPTSSMKKKKPKNGDKSANSAKMERGDSKGTNSSQGESYLSSSPQSPKTSNGEYAPTNKLDRPSMPSPPVARPQMIPVMSSPPPSPFASAAPVFPLSLPPPPMVNGTHDHSASSPLPLPTNANGSPRGPLPSLPTPVSTSPSNRSPRMPLPPLPTATTTPRDTEHTSPAFSSSPRLPLPPLPSEHPTVSNGSPRLPLPSLPTPPQTQAPAPDTTKFQSAYSSDEDSF